MKSFSLFLAYLCCAIINTSCEKEYSYEGGPTTGTGGGTAVYTLEGDGGNCAGPVINGTYTTSTTLLPSDNIQLRVNVTTPGTYTLSTGLENGIQFSASGNFTATGLQTITLTGSGTPIAAGTFRFSPTVGLGCTFFVTVTTAPQTAHFTLEGEPGICSNFLVNGMYISGDTLTGDNTVEVTVNVTATGSYSISTDTVDNISFLQSGNFTATGIQKVILRGFGTPSTADFFTYSIKTGTSGCTFSVTVLTPGPRASYELESTSDHSCTGYAITGMYYSGTPLTGTNTIAVKVFVTDPGNFAISTGIVNGIIFYYSGNFVSTGSQFVLLNGSGTPVSAGTFTFTPQIIGTPIVGGSCTTDIEVH